MSFPTTIVGITFNLSDRITGTIIADITLYIIGTGRITTDGTNRIIYYYYYCYYYKYYW